MRSQGESHEDAPEPWALRDQVDGLIRDIWDEAEFAFRREEPSTRRRKAREYGTCCATRPDEERGSEEP